MLRLIPLFIFIICQLICGGDCIAQNAKKKTAVKKGDEKSCSPSCKAENSSTELSCKLASEDLHQRKVTVLASLKSKMLEKKELENGYAFRFAGTDEVIDEIAEFIKTERECCDFFIFNLSVSGDKSQAWLELTGPDGAKEFVTEEMGW